MKKNRDIAKRVAGIALFFAALTVSVFVAGESLRRPAHARLTAPAPRPPAISAEGGMYLGYAAPMTLAPRRPGARLRTPENFYGLRAYNGAPPMIPHAAGAENRIADGCLDCHKNGGYVPKWNAYAPVSPHPMFGNCRQCHLPQNLQTALFRPTEWQRPAPPVRQIRAMPGAPLVMPHGTQLRGNCQSCHAGPGAVKEFQASHPWRTNCRQCHVPPETGEEFSRPITQGGDHGPG